MAVSDLLNEFTDENGDVYFKMRSFDVEVRADQNSGLAPVISYWIGEKDITDDIRKLRFSPRPPSTYIEDYDTFQTMLYTKEQNAINQLYERISIKPKNMSTPKQILWNFFVISLIILPLLLVVWWTQ
ncbi:MAG: sodium:proton antiporter [Lysinibacillus sp.]